MAEPHNPHHATDEADADAVAYMRGEQEINEQRATWDLFMNLAKWGSLAIAVAVLFLTLWFTPGGSFMAGFIAAVVLAGAGWFFLKGGKAEGH